MSSNPGLNDRDFVRFRWLRADRQDDRAAIMAVLRRLGREPDFSASPETRARTWRIMAAECEGVIEIMGMVETRPKLGK